MFDTPKALLLPSGLITSCCIIGVIFIFFGKLRRVGIFMLAASGILYAVLGSGPISFWLIGNLENQYPPLTISDELKKIDIIVILAGHAEGDALLPLSSRANSASAYRVIEGLRLFRAFPDTHILISGGWEVPKILKDLLISLGVPASRVFIENESSNTYESVLNVQKRIGNKSFILVTSAGHMPRAMSVFHNLGMHPVPAPTHYMSIRNYRWIAYLPSPLHLTYSDFAIHEYMGIAWYRLKHLL